MKSNKKKKTSAIKPIRLLILLILLISSILALVYLLKKPQVLDANAMSIFNSVNGMETEKHDDYTVESFYLGPYKTALYYPSGNTKYKAPYPVIVFHHGMMAKYEYYKWLGEEMAKKGYIVAIPNRLLLGINMEGGVKMTSSLFDYLSVRNKYSGSLKKKVDLSKVGIAGHSMGADLTLYGAGMKTKKPVEIKALVAIAPASKETEAMKVVAGATKETLGKYIETSMNKIYETVSAPNQKPIMFIVGSNDGISQPKATYTFYNMNKSKKMLLVLNGANHVQFSPAGAQGDEVAAKLDKKATMPNEEVLSLTKTYLGAWMDYFVKGDQSAKSVLEQGKSFVPKKFTTYTLEF